MQHEFNNEHLAATAVRARQCLKELEEFKAKEEVLKKASEGYVIALLNGSGDTEICCRSDESVLWFDAPAQDYKVLPKTKEVSVYIFSHYFEGELLISYRRNLEYYNEAKEAAKQRGSKILREWVETYFVEVDE